MRIISITTFVGTALITFCQAVGSAALASVPDWSVSGQNQTNWRYQPNETKIGSSNVNTLLPKWVFTTGGDVSATPAVSDNSVYFPDWGGNLYDLNANSGTVNWQVNLNALPGISNTVSRTTPTLYGNTLLVGTQNGAHALAFNSNNGQLLWQTKLDNHPFAVITQSPVVYNGLAYMGVSSVEEGAAISPDYDCCTFRGSVLAVDIATGEIKWKTHTTLDNNGQSGGYSGAAVWGSTPVVDDIRKSLYITTGNNYDVPQSVKDDPTTDDPANLIDAVVSLDLTTGSINWARKLGGSDAWNAACLTNGINCPNPTGPDFDFGQGTMLIRSQIGGIPQDILIAGQKSGVVWGIKPDDGTVLWATTAGPGGLQGGLQWGSATDGNRIYYAIGNRENSQYTLKNGQTVTSGFWGALDAATGEILWQTADPNGAMALGAVSVANGVVYAGSMSPLLSDSTFFALDAATGEIKWQYASGGSVNSGPAIVDGTIYWGSGYERFGLGSGNNKFYAFASEPPVSVPEPRPIFGLTVLTAIAIGSLVKRKL